MTQIKYWWNNTIRRCIKNSNITNFYLVSFTYNSIFFFLWCYISSYFSLKFFCLYIAQSYSFFFSSDSSIKSSSVVSLSFVIDFSSFVSKFFSFETKFLSYFILVVSLLYLYKLQTTTILFQIWVYPYNNHILIFY